MNDSAQLTFDADDLGGVDVIYADSKEALLRAYGQGLSRVAEVRSTSPALILDPELTVVQADASMTHARIKGLEHAFAEMGRDCRGRFGDPDWDLIASRFITLEFQAAAGKAAFIEDADFETPTAIVTLTGEDRYLDSIVRSPLLRLLSDNPNLRPVLTPIGSLSGRDDPRQPDPSLYSRLRFTSFATIMFRLSERLTARFGLRGPKGSILMIRDNELSKETAFHLMLRGYWPRQLEITRVDNAPGLPVDKVEGIRQTSEELVEERLGEFVSPRARRALSRILAEDLIDRFERYNASLAVWDRKLDELAQFRPRVVLTNRINDPELIGLHAKLRARGLPLVGFQHGVTVEINRHMRELDAHYESAFCDLELTFNERAAAYSNANVLRRGRAVSIGLPAEYFRGSKKGRLAGAPPIWFINTAFYVANHGQLEGTTDREKCRHEVDIIENVLSRLQHRVLYKPYPGRRFEDLDPIEAAAVAAENVDFYRDRLDLRYVVGSARVLISSRGFSTPSWCLVTGLPLVHIDIPEQEPLSPSARKAFETGVFLFDSGDLDFHERLRDFLNQPIELIEEQWREKADARAELIETFVSATRDGAGRRGADVVENLIRARSAAA